MREARSLTILALFLSDTAIVRREAKLTEQFGLSRNTIASQATKKTFLQSIFHGYQTQTIKTNRRRSFQEEEGVGGE